MKYRILDIDGDYSFGKGQQDITYGAYAVAQAIKTRLSLLQGEWWEDVEEGLPLFQDILGTGADMNNLLIVDGIIRDRILSTKDVLNITEFDSLLEGRNYTFTCRVDTKYGEINISDLDLN